MATSDNDWTTFATRVPCLWDSIEVDMGDKIINLGTILHILDLGNGWVSLTTDNVVGAAVSPKYKWRKMQ